MKGSKVLRCNRGVTLVEIMMVVGVMGILFLGLFTLINKVTKGTWQISGMLGMNSDATEAMYWIGNDFRNAKASTMGGQMVDLLGDQAMNPGFELPLDLASDTPAKWVSLAAFGVSRVSGPADVRSGFMALGLPSGTSYYSQISTTTYTAREYIVSGWTRPSGTVELRLLQGIPVDTNFAIPCSTSTPASANWVHLTTTTIMVADKTPFKFRMRYPAGDTFWFKTMTQAVDTAGRDYGFNYGEGLGTYGNELYMAANRTAVANIGPVKWNGRNRNIWTNVPEAGLPVGDAVNYYYNLAPSLNSEYNGVVYAFRSRLLSIPNVELADMYTFDGTNWTLMPNLFFQGTGARGRSEVYCYAVFNNRLYVGGIWQHRLVMGFMLPEPTVWSWDALAWTRPYQDAAARDAVIDLCVHNNRLYALCVWPPPFTSTRLVSSDDVTPWGSELAFTARLDTDFGAGNYVGQKMVSYNGNLYVGIFPAVGNTRLYFWDGVSWQTAPGLFLNEPCNIQAMYVHNNVLFIGTGATGVGNLGGKIYSLNTAPPLVEDYVLPGADTIKRIRSFTLFNGILYANYLAVTIGAPNTGETGILELSEVSYFDDVCLSPRQVVLSPGTTDTNYEYYTSKGAGNQEGNRFRRYRLNYTSITDRDDPAWPGILRRERFAGGWINEGPEDLCKNVRQLTITNDNQESFDVELVLEKVIEAGKTKEYRVRSRFTPAVP